MRKKFFDCKENSAIGKENIKSSNKFFGMQEEIIASYEAAYGEAPGLIEEQHEEEQPNEIIF